LKPASRFDLEVRFSLDLANLEFRKFRTNLRRVYLGSAIHFANPHPVWFAAGAAMAAAGILFHFWASGYLTRGRTLVASGPYTLVRNPYYAAALAVDLGFGLASRNWIALAIFLPLIGAVYAYRIRKEEKAMAAAFGEAFEAYRRACPARLVPRPWLLFRRTMAGGPGFSLSAVVRNREFGRSASHIVLLALVGAPLLWPDPWCWLPVEARAAVLGVFAFLLLVRSVRRCGPECRGEEGKEDPGA
jgi:hypothetical protein